MHAIRFNLTLILGTILIPLQTAPESSPRTRMPDTALENSRPSTFHTARNCARSSSRWVADLADLADKSSGPEANDAYRQLFNVAIARDLCVEAMPAARNCLASIPSGQDVRALAASVQVFARAEKGEYEQSLRPTSKALFKRSGCGAYAAAKSDAATALAVGEAYLQRLNRDGRHDVARRLCELACKDDAPTALKHHFEARMALLDLLGKPAPVISGTDVDGHQVSLADLKGKVVLVDFWESSCSQCVASFIALDALAQKYDRRGFVIVGVNLDAKHPDVKDAKTALPTARQVLVRHGVTWINLLDCQRTDDITAAYGLQEIPANFLIGRDGTIVAMEQSGDALEHAVVRALGVPARWSTSSARARRSNDKSQTSSNDLLQEPAEHLARRQCLSLRSHHRFKETTAMTSQRWNTLVSILVLALVLTTAGSARAQWGFPGISGQPGVSQFGLGYGSWTAYGTSPYDTATARSERQAT